MYKNVYCALCNAKELSALTCAPISTRPTSWRAYIGPNIIKLLRPVTTQGNCAYRLGIKCYITSTAYRYKNVTHNVSNVNATSVEYGTVSHSIHQYLTTVCMNISLVCLALKAFVYAGYKDSRGYPSKCMLCLSSTLFFSHLLFLLANSFPLLEAACVVSGIVLHYGFLATFSWASLMMFDIWKSILVDKVCRSGSRLLFIKYCLISWCFPLCLVVTCVTVDYSLPSSPLAPRYGEGSCWISSAAVQAFFFLTPMMVFLTAHVVLYVNIVLHVRRTVRQAGSFEFRSGRQLSQGRLFLRLASITGATWILGLISAFLRLVVLDAIVIVLIGLQGAYLFFGFQDYRYIIGSLRSRKKQTEGGQVFTVETGT